MTIGRGVITGVSVAHQWADLDAIETACADGQRAVVQSLLADPGVEEAFALQTCNRAEAYVVTETPEAGRDALAHTVGGVPDEMVRWFEHEDALSHLMRVACGLESLVIGEGQIMGQVRTAYTDALAVGGVGPLLEEAVTKAIHVGERARDETGINEGVVSLGSAAVRLAERDLGDLDDRAGLVVGAGEMGKLAASALGAAVDRLVVANRTLPHAEHLADTVDAPAEAVGLDALADALADADVVVSATGSPGPVVEREALQGAGETFVVDLGQPRDVAPSGGLPDVTVYDLDDLEALTDATAERRNAAAEAVEAMVDLELDHLLSRFKRKRADEVIASMYEGAERVKEREVAKAVAQLEAKTGDDLPDEQREVVESLADALVGQLLAAPTKSLRDAAEEDDWSTINTALELFDPAFDGPAPGAASPEDVPEELRDRVPDGVLEGLDD